MTYYIIFSILKHIIGSVVFVRFEFLKLYTAERFKVTRWIEILSTLVSPVPPGDTKTM